MNGSYVWCISPRSRKKPLELAPKSLPLGPKTMKYTLLHLKKFQPAAGLFFKGNRVVDLNSGCSALL